MATLYGRSTDGSDADGGTTWALAKATVSGLSAIDAAGDTCWLSQVHNESVASSSNAWAGTNANPTKVLCGNDATQPPTVPTTGAVVTVSGTTFTWTGAATAYGIQFTFSSASSWAAIFNGLTAFAQVFDTCKFFYTGNAAGSTLGFGSGTAAGQSRTELLNCQFKLANAGQRINADRDIFIRGGSWASGGTNPTGVFTLGSTGRPTTLVVEGFDFSNLGTTVNLIQAITEGSCKAIFRYVKVPASWTGSLVASGAIKLGNRIEMHNFDSGDTNYKLWIEDYAGTIRDETTIVRTGGASDGTTQMTWKMTTSANAGYPVTKLESPERAIWKEVVGSAITCTVQVVHDSQGAGSGSKVQDDEWWLEVQSLNTSGVPLSSFTIDAKASVVAAAANQTDSTDTWVTTGLTTPVKQALSVTFTPQEKGYLLWKVCGAKASKTVYADAKMTVT
jgi:hypothetical protein